MLHAMSLHVVTWNVNSLRSCLTKGFSTWLTATNPDIICLQEVRAELKHLHPLEGLFPNHRCYWNPSVRPGYAGTAILTKFAPISTVTGLLQSPDPQGRALTADFGTFRVMSLYAPNASPLTEKIPLKVQWLTLLKDQVKRYQEKPLILCGDLNVAHTRWDSRGQQHPLGMNGCTREEREGFQQLLKECALIDPIRERYQDEILSTWWHVVSSKRHPLDGMRLDYILLQKTSQPIFLDQQIQSLVFGSDHCPVSMKLAIDTSALTPASARGQTSLL